jgi:hypothetical protein
MTDARPEQMSLEEIRRQLSSPVSPRDTFARSLLERLEAEKSGNAQSSGNALSSEELSSEELAAESGEALPLREAMTVITPDPITPLDPGCVLPVEPLPAPDQPI